MSYLSGRDKIFIMTHPEFPLDQKIVKTFKKLEKKRLNNWPIAYLTGIKEFFGRDFIVSKSVLVPRPETEIMIEEILQNESINDNFFDIGTGSGAIIVSLAAEIKKTKPQIYRQANFFGIDISQKALEIAALNAKKHRLDNKIIFKKSNLLSSIKKDIALICHKQEGFIIAANLPYLNPKEMKEPSISKEPKNALLSGSDGLKHYKNLFSQLKNIKNLSESKFSIYCEINPDQTQKIKIIATANFPRAKILFIKDLSNRNRFCLIKNIL